MAEVDPVARGLASPQSERNHCEHATSQAADCTKHLLRCSHPASSGGLPFGATRQPMVGRARVRRFTPTGQSRVIKYRRKTLENNLRRAPIAITPFARAVSSLRKRAYGDDPGF